MVWGCMGWNGVGMLTEVEVLPQVQQDIQAPHQYEEVSGP